MDRLVLLSSAVDFSGGGSSGVVSPVYFYR